MQSTEVRASAPAAQFAGEFDYLLARISDAPFLERPFRHLLIEDFLSPGHLERVTRCSQLALPPQQSSEALIAALEEAGFGVQAFPGCTTDVADYLRRLERNDWPVDKAKLEGYGLTFRLNRIDEPLLARLVAFLNGDAFHKALEAKFGIRRPNRIETAVQKYLAGYEISPHPDIRSKCLTYLLNINTNPQADRAAIHTHLLSFKPEWAFIYDYWETHPQYDRCWVPWDWCTTEKTVSANNSVVLFHTHERSLHAIKLRYDHTRYQRTQIYGNLWYTDCPFMVPAVEYGQFDLKPLPNLGGNASAKGPLRRVLSGLKRRLARA